ncbi:MAG: hypothetical protein KY445_02870 [Armatimonadetes bacterium]|nr:hypothetical protein [Armatimonadota bacterium]
MNSRFSFRPFLFSLVSPLRVPQVPLAVAFTASLLGFSSLSPLPARAQTAPATAKPIVVNIDGRVSSPDPAPLLEGGVVYVPLRGVLENLGARVEYFPAEKRIEIRQNDKTYVLRPGIANATVGSEILPVAAPKLVAGRAFVPLRSIAELFGYRVGWLSAERTVAIYTNDSIKPVFVDHRAQLRSGGAFGVAIDFAGAPLAEIPRLLDAAKSAGAGLVKTRFDWNTLQPEKNGAFDWSVYDAVVREARARGLKVVGVLGNSTQWASVSLSNQPDEWRNSPPKESELAAWSNYVKRVVGRYRVDVQAWQVWENPSAQNFRSVPRNYRNLLRLATEAARQSDAKAIVHAAEPGGVELDFIGDLTRNGLTSIDGVTVFPVAQWQPGVANAPESFILPYAILREQGGRGRDYWLGGASAPVVELKTPDASLTEAQRELLVNFSPAAQADYLVRLFALSLAGGREKLFWNPLQDSPPSASEALSPFVAGTGLVRSDGTRRPAFNAFKMMSANVGSRPYAGNLSFDRNAIALLFDDKKTGTLVAWSPNGAASLNLSSSGLPDPRLPGSTFVATRPDSQVLDSSGAVIAPPDGVIRLTQRPVVITNVGLDTATAAAARLGAGGLRLAPSGTSYAAAQEVRATFTSDGVEDGLFWRRFQNFGGMARKFSTYYQEQNGLVTEAQREILDLQSSKPFIYLDVADDFLFNAGGVPVTITVEVRRPPASSGSSIINSASGFRVEYDSPTGYKSTPFQIVEPGEGWATYTFAIPDASFANAEGYDLLINTNGSKRNLTFGSLAVRRGAPSVAQPVQ